MNVPENLLIATTIASAGWWAFRRDRHPAALQGLSVLAALVAGAALVLDGLHYANLPWVLTTGAVAGAAARRQWRPGPSRAWHRVVGRVALAAGCLAGALAAMLAFVPQLPSPPGPRSVGSQIFRWTDHSRPESLTADSADHRQVVAQAWYPTHVASGRTTPYDEAPNRLPSSVAGLPRFLFSGFQHIDTHATLEAPISAARDAWPVLVFTPGLSVPREWYAELCANLASRGYVVLALSASYESPITVLSDGEVAYQAVHPDVSGPPPHPAVERLIDLRVADVSFALDQLEQRHGTSALRGRLDLAHVGIVGHSIGGATAVQAMAADPRLRTGVNLDGKLFGDQPDGRIGRPVLWIESDDPKTGEYVDGRDRLMRNLGHHGAVLRLPASTHMSFSDSPRFWTAAGRRLFDDLVGIGSPTTTERAAAAIDRFERRALGVGADT